MNNLLQNKMYKLSLLKFLIIKLTIQKVEKQLSNLKKIYLILIEKINLCSKIKKYENFFEQS
jgi:hypothetical protein